MEGSGTESENEAEVEQEINMLHERLGRERLESDSDSTGASVNVVSLAKHGFFTNNFIMTQSSAYQQDSAGRNFNLDKSSNMKLDLLPLNVQYLEKIRREQAEREKYRQSLAWTWKTFDRQMSKLVMRKKSRPEISIAGSDPVDSALKNVLQSLVNMIRPTEVVRFLSALKTSKVNDTYFEPTEVNYEGPSPMSDLFVAIVSNGKDGIETSIVLLLKMKPKETQQQEVKRVKERKFKTMGSNNPSSRRPVDSLRPKSAKFSDDSTQHSLSAASVNSKRESAGRSSQKKGQRKIIYVQKTNNFKPQFDLEVMSMVQVLSDTRIRLNGGGQLKIISNRVAMQIDTVSIRSLWGFVTALQRSRHVARMHNFYLPETGHAWTEYYLTEMNKNLSTLSRNFRMYNNQAPSKLRRRSSIIVDSDSSAESDYDADVDGNLPSKKEIKTVIKQIISKFDPDKITTLDVYKGLQEKFGEHILGENGYSKSLVDKYTITAVGQLDPPSEILPGLYLGTEYNASNRKEMTTLGIKYVVNVTEEVENFFPNYMEYHAILLKDRPHCNLKEHFDEAADKMDDALKESKGILVHCQRGISRSATIVIVYLMKYHGMTKDEAYKFVKQKRPIVRPNNGFLTQLEEYESELNEET